LLLSAVKRSADGKHKRQVDIYRRGGEFRRLSAVTLMA